MELRHLKYFATVAKTLNFSDAAKRLFVTHGTLFQQIKQFEAEIGAQLFDRNRMRDLKGALTGPSASV